ncbi:guanylin [Dugong dugon]
MNTFLLSVLCLFGAWAALADGVTVQSTHLEAWWTPGGSDEWLWSPGQWQGQVSLAPTGARFSIRTRPLEPFITSQQLPGRRLELRTPGDLLALVSEPLGLRGTHLEGNCQGAEPVVTFWTCCFQDGDFSFPLESVKKLKDLQGLHDAGIGKDRKARLARRSVVPILCSYPGFPKELEPVCNEPNAQEILQRLEAIAQEPSTCEICAYAACAGC